MIEAIEEKAILNPDFLFGKRSGQKVIDSLDGLAECREALEEMIVTELDDPNQERPHYYQGMWHAIGDGPLEIVRLRIAAQHCAEGEI
jgi:hypothetical protein